MTVLGSPYAMMALVKSLGEEGREGYVTNMTFASGNTLSVVFRPITRNIFTRNLLITVEGIDWDELVVDDEIREYYSWLASTARRVSENKSDSHRNWVRDAVHGTETAWKLDYEKSLEDTVGHTLKGSYLFDDTLKQVSTWYDGEYIYLCTYDQADIKQHYDKAKKIECVEAFLKPFVVEKD